MSLFRGTNSNASPTLHPALSRLWILRGSREYAFAALARLEYVIPSTVNGLPFFSPDGGGGGTRSIACSGVQPKSRRVFTTTEFFSNALASAYLIFGKSDVCRVATDTDQLFFLEK